MIVSTKLSVCFFFFFNHLFIFKTRLVLLPEHSEDLKDS